VDGSHRHVVEFSAGRGECPAVDAGPLILKVAIIMEIIYLLIPLSVVLVGLIIWIFLWAIRSGQFDDLEGPAHSIIMDDDSPKIQEAEDGSGDKEDKGER
jgi:cbb3-type cytochrome oxidase maturation protein